jgi:hypothetical protein
MNVLLLLNIANALATLGRNPAFGADVNAGAQVFSLAGIAFQEFAMNDAERQILLEQIQRANAEGRVSLTDEETAQWHTRHEVAKAAIQGWKQGN